MDLKAGTVPVQKRIILNGCKTLRIAGYVFPAIFNTQKPLRKRPTAVVETARIGLKIKLLQRERLKMVRFLEKTGID
jgi:hypothetical protein